MATQIIADSRLVMGILLVQLSSLVAMASVRFQMDSPGEHSVRMMEHGPMVLHNAVILNY